MTQTTNKTETPKLGRSARRVDGDISALKACIRGLNKSTSRRMLKANLEYLIDRYLWHPAKDLPEHLRPNAEVSDGGPLTHELPAAQSRRSLH